MNGLIAPQFMARNGYSHSPEQFSAQEYFLDSLPRWTNAAHRKDKFTRHEVSRTVSMRYIAPDQKNAILWLKFDIDLTIDVGKRGSQEFEHTAARWLELGLAQPHVIVQSFDNLNLGSHYLYGLRVPVYRTGNISVKALQLHRTVIHGMTRVLGADGGFSGATVKNPFHKNWHAIWADRPLYDLGDLFDDLPRELRRPAPRGEAVGEGRHSELFLSLRVWAYREIAAAYLVGDETRWKAACTAEAHAQNIFSPKLPYREVQTLGLTVAKWTWQRGLDFVHKQDKKTGVWKRSQSYSWNRRPLTPDEARERMSEGRDTSAQVQRNATRDKIIAAIGQLVQAGRAEPSRRQIAQAAGVGEATVSRYRASLNINAGGNY